ncbi:MAG TPA: hypothetical protein VK960_08090 [Acidimicrobiia bacterium]|nr:hypothetical protein [Acidimicrobiia bacterium]
MNCAVYRFPGQISLSVGASLIVVAICVRIALVSSLAVGAGLAAILGFMSLSSGLQCVTVDETGVTIQRTFLLRTSIAWTGIDFAALPDTSRAWNYPFLRLSDGSRVGLTPLAFGRFQPRKREFARLVVGEINAYRRSHGVESSGEV